MSFGSGSVGASRDRCFFRDLQRHACPLCSFAQSRQFAPARDTGARATPCVTRFLLSHSGPELYLCHGPRLANSRLERQVLLEQNVLCFQGVQECQIHRCSKDTPSRHRIEWWGCDWAFRAICPKLRRLATLPRRDLILHTLVRLSIAASPRNQSSEAISATE